MKRIQVLDVTLRDGGIVNDFNFGEKNIHKIIDSLEKSNVDFIELGYLEKNTGTERQRSQFINEKVIPKYFLKKKKKGVSYSVMFDYGKFDADTLEKRTKNGIDAIRFAFHKRNLDDVEEVYKKIIAKGYDTYMQPMVTIHYSDEELAKLVDIANRLDIKGFYFVDTFGQMRQPDIERLTKYFDERLRKDIALGFHAHNNIQMAYSNVITFLQYPTKRDKMVDGSILGMGRGAGNATTELLLEHLNLYYDKKYNIAPLLSVIDSVLNKIKLDYPWGYSVEYYLSSINDCSPIYAGYYYKKHMLPVEQINELLKMVKGEKRISFDKKYAEEIYIKYNAKSKFDDTKQINALKRAFKGKNVCLIAPGKSIVRQAKKVTNTVKKSDIVVSLNCDAFDSDYIFISRKDSYKEYKDSNKKIIVVSSVNRKEKYTIDYLKWVHIDEETCDSSGYLAINLLSSLECKNIYLAGFDGFTADINQNYYDQSLKREISTEQLISKNEKFAKFIKAKQKTSSIKFITDSIYNK